MLRLLSRSLDYIENLFAALGGLLLVVSMLSVAAEVGSRYFLNRSYIIVNELNEYILLYVPFLAAAWLLRENGHITVDLLDRVLPIRILKVLNVIIVVVGVLVTACLTWYGLNVAADAYMRNLLSTTVVQFPQVYVLAVIPLGAFLLLLEFVRKSYRIATGTEPIEHQSDAMAE